MNDTNREAEIRDDIEYENDDLNSSACAYLLDALERARERERVLREAALPFAEAGCYCNEAWTARDMHEPLCIHREFGVEIETLRALLTSEDSPVHTERNE